MPAVHVFACFCLLLHTGLCVAAEPPDVLFIIVDDLRPMLGCYGDRRIHTPNIDRLADRGIVFERAYCQYAKCGTSRLSMLTGLRPDAIDVFSNNARDVARFRRDHLDAVSLPRWLKLHGYFTQAFGKIYHDGWDLAEDWSVPSSPGRPGEMLEIMPTNVVTHATIVAERFNCPVMQRADVADNYLFAGRMTDNVLMAMATPQQKSRFMAVGYRRPHLPFVAPERYYELYKPDATWLAQFQRPPENSPTMAWFNSDGYVKGAARAGLLMPAKPTRTEAIDWNGYEMRSYNGVPNSGPISDVTQLQLLHAYAACVSYVDAQIGRLLDGLQKTTKADNTIIVFCSDHGWHLGEHSVWGKMTNFEIATRVPMIILDPRTAPGRTRTVAELVDLYPTLCDLTETPLPEHLEGNSLVPVLKAPAADQDTSYALSQYSRFGGQYMGYAIRTDRYRYVEWCETPVRQVVHRELYDHSSDPHEHVNLASDNEKRAVVGRLAEQLRISMRQFGSPTFRSEN